MYLQTIPPLLNVLSTPSLNPLSERGNSFAEPLDAEPLKPNSDDVAISKPTPKQLYPWQRYIARFAKRNDEDKSSNNNNGIVDTNSSSTGDYSPLPVGGTVPKIQVTSATVSSNSSQAGGSGKPRAMSTAL